MPIARVQLPDGRIARFEVPEGTTPEQVQQQANQQFGGQDVGMGGGAIPSDVVDKPGVEDPSFLEHAAGALGAFGRQKIADAETLAALGSGIIAEPIAGLAGIAQAINPFAEEGAGGRAVEAVREALTVQPITEAGQAQVQAVAGALAPVGEVISGAEKFLGDETLELTGSPALAAAAATLPTAIGEVLGVALGRGAVKGSQAIKETGKQKDITKLIVESAPEIDQLQDVSRAVYKEIDDLGVSLQPKAFSGMVNKIRKEVKDQGFDKNLNPKTAAVLKAFDEKIASRVPPTLTEVDTMRKIAGGAAKSLEPAEAALGVTIINTMDNFLDQLGSTGFKAPKSVNLADIRPKYKAARDLWGRARRSELIQESFEKAKNQASGFENGVRTQFRSILNNKKKSKFFKPDEITAMQKVVRGGAKENILKLIGKLGFSEGQASGFLGGSIGIGAGAHFLGPVGAVGVPLIGQVAKKLAQKLTVRNAEFADTVVRAGTDARKIAEAYIDNVPKKQRSSAELSQLLTNRTIDLDDLLGSQNIILKEAAEIAKGRRAIDIGGLTGAATVTAALEDES